MLRGTCPEPAALPPSTETTCYLSRPTGKSVHGMRFTLIACLVGLVAATSIPGRSEQVQYLRASPVAALANPAPTTISNCNAPQDACTSNDVEYKCLGGPLSRCWCNPTVEGEAVCFNSAAECTSYKSCTSSSECAANQKCFNVVSCGCRGLTKVCSDVKPAVNGTCAF